MKTTSKFFDAKIFTVQSVLTLVAAASIYALTACAPENPRLMAPPVKYKDAGTEAKPQVMTVSPKVDILMVIDNSDSMLDEQNELSRNIDKFTQGLAANAGIDFHIGAVAIWDTVTYKDMKKDYVNGQLRKLKGPDGKPLGDEFAPFVASGQDYDSVLAKRGVSLAKDPGWLQVLRASLKVGTESYNPKFKTEHTGGPNIEEMFTPVKAALSEPMASTVNKGFRRKDAHLVMIFITDSDASVRNADGTSYDLSPGELRDFLAAELGEDFRDKASAIGVLARSTDDPKERDPSIRYGDKGPTEPVQIQSFIRDMGGKWMGLRDKNYGTAMADLGAYVRSRTLANPRIDLAGLPEWGTIRVELNGVELKAGEGWLYDDKTNSVIITHDLTTVSGAIDIKVKFTQVSVGGRVEKL